MTHEDALAHFGVKGMHWGVHKAEPSSGSGKSGGSPAKAKNPKIKAADIYAARIMQDHLAMKSWDLYDKATRATTEKGRMAAQKALEKNAAEFDSYDAVARKKTGIEKIANIMVWGGTAVVVAGAAASFAGGRR